MARTAQCVALAPGKEFCELNIMSVNVAVVIIPPLSCMKHSMIAIADFVNCVKDSNQSKRSGTSLAYEVHRSTLITHDVKFKIKNRAFSILSAVSAVSKTKSCNNYLLSSVHKQTTVKKYNC